MNPDLALPLSTRSPAARRDSTVVAIGVGFLAAAVVLSAVNSRPDGDLDLTNYLVGLLATVALLGTAGYALVTGATTRAGSDDARRSNLVVWPAAFGALAVGLMIVVGLDDSSFSVYLAALVILGISAGGYLKAPGGALAISGLVGAAALYSQLIDDLINIDDFDSGYIAAGLVVLIFTVAVTGLGWLLPRTRALTGVVAGVFAVVSYVAIMVAISFAAAFSGAFAGFEDDAFSDSQPEVDTYTNDVYVTLFFAILLIATWALAAYLTGEPGFKVLIVAMTATVLPAATFALAIEHPGWWGLGAALIGAGVLGAVIVRGAGRASATPAAAAAAAPAYPPPADDAPPPPPPLPPTT